MNKVTQIKIIRFCPICIYEITDICFRYARFDYDCPGCQKRKLSEFTVIRTIEKFLKGERDN